MADDQTRRNLEYGTSQWLNYTRDSYLERTSRPLYGILFLLPFIVFYELGTILINTDVLNQSQVRVVAFVWLQQWLGYLGYSGKLAWIAPPLVVVMILLGLQLSSRKPWNFYVRDVIPMAMECALMAIPLIVLSLFINNPPVPQEDMNQIAAALGLKFDLSRLLLQVGTGAVGPSLLASLVTGVGAGIYEELVFRLILICFLMMIFQDLLGVGHRKAIVLSVLISAALFSAHHHVVIIDGQLAQSAQFNLSAFLFRTMAGVYFAVLFAARGFGITAGTHACYDIIATIINSIFFNA
jgi:hypothetical protein